MDQFLTTCVAPRTWGWLLGGERRASRATAACETAETHRVKMRRPRRPGPYENEAPGCLAGQNGAMDQFLTTLRRAAHVGLAAGRRTTGLEGLEEKLVG